VKASGLVSYSAPGHRAELKATAVVPNTTTTYLPTAFPVTKGHHCGGLKFRTSLEGQRNKICRRNFLFLKFHNLRLFQPQN
jgi:hypothetical protein